MGASLLDQSLVVGITRIFHHCYCCSRFVRCLDYLGQNLQVNYQKLKFLHDTNKHIIQVCVRVRLSSVACNKAKVGAYATVSPFSGDLLGDSRMSNVLDKSFIHRSYPKLAYGSIPA